MTALIVRPRATCPLIRQLVLVSMIAMAAVPCPGAEEDRPNVLFVILDDNNDWISILGRPEAHTPNLERIARRGTLFTRAYCSVPACAPSRTSLLTGVAPSTSGAYFNGQPFRRAPQWISRVNSLPAHFRAHGYLAAGYGKVFHNSEDDRDSWSSGWFMPKLSEDQKLAEQATWLTELGNVWPYHWGALSDDWDREDPARMQQDTTHAIAMAKLVAEKHDRPFFAALGIFRPHVPWIVPQRYFDLYPMDKVPLPEGVLASDLDDVPAPGQWLAEVNVTPDTNRIILERNLWRHAIQAYLASISYADDLLGRVLDALERGPNAGNTIIVLLGDHGYHLGEKEHWNKFTLWERSARVPLLIAVPGIAGGGIRETPVSLLDLYPTLLGLTGLPLPETHGLDGVNLKPVLDGRRPDRGAPVITTYGRNNHAVRNDRWRYIRYRTGEEELYDHAADPHEWHNLAGEPSARAVMDQLAVVLPGLNADNIPFVDKRGVAWLDEEIFGPQ